MGPMRRILPSAQNPRKSVRSGHDRARHGKPKVSPPLKMAISSAVEHLPYKEIVAGSIPASPT